MEDKDILRGLYRNYYGSDADEMQKLAGSGGDRVYYRMKSPAGVCIGTVGDSLSDCRAFTGLSRVFRRHGIDVPEVYAVADDGLHYIQQDLGDTSLLSLRGTEEWRQMAAMAMLSMARMQSVDGSEWKDIVAYRPFSRRQVLWDLTYFKYEYLKPLRVPFDEELLEDDFERLASRLTGDSAGPWGFMMRDCQSRNVMVSGGKPWWIDFQGGRRGPVAYDVVSMLWQAKAGLSDNEKKELAAVYAAEYERITGNDAGRLLDALPLLAFFRTLQVLGAYGFRGLVEKKAHFIESIDPALRNLENLYQRATGDDLPELRRVCSYVCAHSPSPAPHDGLLVKVYSFSYKKGYPADFTGNGGGFMFDCRGMHNPGRYDEYKPLTGLDLPVREFLEERGEVQKFVAEAFDLVSPSVECYLRRGFSDLQVGFGCTGGRHRSVYCADMLARRIAAAFPDAKVMVIHREQNITEKL